jgi:hypothetical protein
MFLRTQRSVVCCCVLLQGCRVHLSNVLADYARHYNLVCCRRTHAHGSLSLYGQHGAFTSPTCECCLLLSHRVLQRSCALFR